MKPLLKFLAALAVCAFLAIPARAQCTTGSQSQVVANQNCVQQLFYNNSSQLTYVCEAVAFQAPQSFYKSSATLTSIGVSTNVGTITFGSTSYLWIGALITVSGSTTTALNGTYVVSGVSGSTATISTSGVVDGTYNTAALVVSTSAPLLNVPVWAIQALKYASSSLSEVFWAGNPSTAIPHTLKCSDRGNY